MATRKPFTIAGQSIAPGRQATIHVPVAPLYTHAQMRMPVHVIHGRQDGPKLFVCGAIHGDELIGVEIIRRVMKLKKLTRLRGTLLAVPVVNIFGFIHQSRYLPDRRDLNRFFPGSDRGSLTSQLADIFMEEVVSRCTHGIDLHAGSNHRTNLPQIRINFEHAEARKLALAFKAPVILNAEPREKSLRQAVAERHIPILLYEAGEALRFDETAIRAGVRGILAVMAELQMLSRAAAGKSRLQPLESEKTTWVRSPASGIFHPRQPLGSRVRKDEVIAEIADPFGGDDVVVRAPETGMIIGQLNLPLVYQGDAILHIAMFTAQAPIQPTLEGFQAEIANDSELSG